MQWPQSHDSQNSVAAVKAPGCQLTLMASRHHDFHHLMCLYGAWELTGRKRGEANTERKRLWRAETWEERRRRGTGEWNSDRMGARCVTSGAVESKKWWEAQKKEGAAWETRSFVAYLSYGLLMMSRGHYICHCLLPTRVFMLAPNARAEAQVGANPFSIRPFT